MISISNSYKGESPFFVLPRDFFAKNTTIGITMMTDEQLLARAKQLDPAALRTLHERYYESVARYIQFKVGNFQTVEDLSGEVFIRVIEGLRKGQAWRESPKGWIMGIARHVVTDYYRKQERTTEVKLSEELISEEDNSPFHQVVLNERKQQLMHAINQLTDEQRDVILMRFIEGINVQGVAKAMNKTPGAVKGLQYRAIRALSEIMQGLVVESVE